MNNTDEPGQALVPKPTPLVGEYMGPDEVRSQIEDAVRRAVNQAMDETVMDALLSGAPALGQRRRRA